MKQLQLLMSLILFTTLLTGCGKAELNPECVMNGLGSGYCSFTNVGSSAGSVCGIVTVNSTMSKEYKTEGESESSTVICSGEIEPSSTNKVEFFVPNLETLCKYGKWSDYCNFAWRAR